MTEEWRAIVGWPYEVSSLGRVRHVVNGMLRDRRHSNGYSRVVLCGDGRRREAYVHRLVLEVFIGPAPDDQPEADHLNMNRSDNRVENLRWLSVAENRARRVLPSGSNHPMSKLSASEAHLLKTLATCSALDRDLARRYKISRETVRDIRLGKIRKQPDGQ